jgi:hypothetical protein
VFTNMWCSQSIHSCDVHILCSKNIDRANLVTYFWCLEAKLYWHQTLQVSALNPTSSCLEVYTTSVPLPFQSHLCCLLSECLRMRRMPWATSHSRLPICGISIRATREIAVARAICGISIRATREIAVARAICGMSIRATREIAVARGRS